MLSLLLFDVYLKKIIVDMSLKCQGVSCHFNGMFVGTLIYTNDITLLAPAKTTVYFSVILEYKYIAK